MPRATSRALLVASLWLCGEVAAAQPVPLPAILDRALGDVDREGPARWPRRPLLAGASRRVGAGIARERWGVDGAGATVCLVDSGVDVAHRDLRDAEGRTRVRWLLDLASPPRGEVATDLEARLGGAVWDQVTIDAALAAGSADRPRDPHGHGTAVAAAAVGDDADAGPPGPWAGIAPAASLVVTRALRDDGLGFRDADVMAGLEMCLAVVGRGEPPVDRDRLVIVLGLGGHDGAHDGTEPLEQAVEEIARSGVPVVVAAGNDGGGAIHARGWLAEAERADVEVWVPDPEPGARHVAVMVETALPGPVSARWRAPDGTRTPAVSPGQAAALDHPGGRLAIDGSREAARDATTRVLYATLTGGDGAPALEGGRYLLELMGPGRFEAWLVDADVGAAALPVRLGGPFTDREGQVTIPATAPSAIAVGALDATTDSPVSWSSRGPTPRGVPKPDLVAPGDAIVTALSGDLVPDDPHGLFGGSPALLASRRVGDDRVTVAGTSFAAPLVAGAVALALSQSPGRGASDRGLLLAGARRLFAAGWTPAGGAGELDVVAFLAGRGGGCAPAIEPAASAVLPSRTVVSPGSASLWAIARLADGGGRPSCAGPVRVEGPDGAVLLPVLGGIAQGPLPAVHARAGEVLTYRAWAGEASLGSFAVRTHVDGARDAAGYGATGGGCSVGRARVAPRDAAWPLLSLLGLSRALRRGGRTR